MRPAQKGRIERLEGKASEGRDQPQAQAVFVVFGEGPTLEQQAEIDKAEAAGKEVILVSFGNDPETDNGG